MLAFRMFLHSLTFITLLISAGTSFADERRNQLVSNYPCGANLDTDRLELLDSWANATKSDPCALSDQEFRLLVEDERDRNTSVYEGRDNWIVYFQANADGDMCFASIDYPSGTQILPALIGQEAEWRIILSNTSWSSVRKDFEYMLQFILEDAGKWDWSAFGLDNGLISLDLPDEFIGDFTSASAIEVRTNANRIFRLPLHQPQAIVSSVRRCHNELVVGDDPFSQIPFGPDSNEETRLPDWLRSAIQEAGDCIDNQTLVEICKAGPGFLDDYFSSQHEAYNALNGTGVCLSFETTYLSVKDGELHGKFSGRSGSWAEDVFVSADVQKANVPSEIKLSDRVMVRGKLSDGNAFYGNLSDNCFVDTIASSIQVDGF